jgi:hypothetical protein
VHARAWERGREHGPSGARGAAMSEREAMFFAAGVLMGALLGLLALMLAAAL